MTNEVTTPPPADAGGMQPEDPNTVGGAIDQKIEALRTELSQRIDQLQAAFEQLGQRVDQAQGQTPAPEAKTTPPTPGQQQAQS